MEPPYDVAMVGAGPVGLMFANLLGGRGHRVLVVEALEKLIDYPRAVGMDDETLRTFQTAGLVDEVLPHTVPNQRLTFVNGAGKVLAQINPRTTEFAWPRRNGFIQPLADRVLLEGLDRHANVEVRWDTRMETLTQTDTRVTLTLESGGSSYDVTASYVVGCDGGRSATRRALDMQFEGKTSTTRWLVIDLASDPLGQPGALIGADPRRPFVSVSLPHGVRRFEFMLYEGETEAMVEDPEFLVRLLDGKVLDPRGIDIIRRREYTHHSRMVADFRSGRVFLAGDAAHIMPVWQGQGYNSGIRDAANLAWKLSAVLAGQCDEQLLASYDQERHAHARAMIDLSTLVGTWVSPTNRIVAGARDALLRSMNQIPSVKRYLVEMRFKPMPMFSEGAVSFATTKSEQSAVGKLMIQPRVDTRELTDQLLDDVVGDWFAVLVWNNNPMAVLDDDARDRLRQLGARLVWLRPECEIPWTDADHEEVLVVGDRTQRLQDWFQNHVDSVLFLRPDRVVAAASPAQGASEMVRAALNALHVALAPARAPAAPGSVA